MKNAFRDLVRRFIPHAFQAPESDAGIAEMGHRGYVGGMWDEIGQLQFNFLVSQGMTPQSRLLDIACGCLRLGVHAIAYLEPEHYLGIDKEAGLIEAGLTKELDPEVARSKAPQTVVSADFEFEKFGQQADFAIAQSLFTHLPPNLIERCFEKLHPWLKDDGAFYATYFETDVAMKNAKTPHDHGYFAYTREEIEGFGSNYGFKARYIGDWNHPRDQKVVEYRKA